MVQRKVPNNLSIQTQHVKFDKFPTNKKLSSSSSHQQNQDDKSKLSKKMKISNSIKLSHLETLQLQSTPISTKTTTTKDGSPNYMKHTSSSQSKKELFHTPCRASKRLAGCEPELLNTLISYEKVLEYKSYKTKGSSYFFSYFEKGCEKKPIEIASVGLLYSIECKKSINQFVNQCRSSWHFDKQYCRNKRDQRLLDDKGDRRGGTITYSRFCRYPADALWEPKFSMYWFDITLIYDMEQSNEPVIDFLMQLPKLFDSYNFYFIGARIFAFLSSLPSYVAGILDTRRYGEQYENKKEDVDCVLRLRSSTEFKSGNDVSVLYGMNL
ncbi:hypothetical protein RYX36_012569 [Vicia faba]